ncbi:hypothetical protein C5E45_33010 [Nocardia nova]|uniref:Uncharacterized protein n=1 Tax=Nocardia nova TaxID=37330 RepID=A0A2S6ACU7_9NOCA|nr:hypothetical protein [Nocardia nova]PPJ31913.1 hypothetical protein C5E45_33010 [Nocardia nova]
MEADLDAHFNRDLRDLWRRDENGCHKLTYRMIYVRLTNGLPATSALARDANGGRTPWTLTDHLLADIWGLEARQLAGRRAKDHPGRPKPLRRQRHSPEREAKLRAAQRRRAQIRHRREGKEG